MVRDGAGRGPSARTTLQILDDLEREQPDRPGDRPGLPWINPGIGRNLGPVAVQKQDDASRAVTDFLNLITGNGALTWYVDRAGVLRIIPIPTVPTGCWWPRPRQRGPSWRRQLVCVRYQATADNADTGAAATYGVVSASNAASNVHTGRWSRTGTLVGRAHGSSAAADAAKAVLAEYVRAKYAGPFTVRQGQLFTLGGTPVDIGAERGIPGVCSSSGRGPFGGKTFLGR